MTPKELNDMLGIKPTEDNASEGFEEAWASDRKTALSAVGPTVFDLDEWEKEQGGRLCPEEENSYHDALPSQYADCFAASFRQYPEVQNECTDKRFGKYMNNLLESPDFNVLHNSTRGNVMASDMATVEFVKQYEKMLVKDEKHSTMERKGDITPEEKEHLNEITCINAAGRALRNAQAEVEELNDMCKAFGTEPGTGGTADVSRITEQFHKVKNNHQLRRIIQLAGRYRFSAQSRQRMKTKHGYDDMVGVELGGDVGRLLPLELAKLADPSFELDAIRRLVERQSMCRLYEGREPQAKGPIVVCVDESGSMAGERIAQAKGFCLAMMWIAKHQKRQCILQSFSFGPDTIFVDTKSKDLPKWLEHFYNRGTDLTVPCVVVPSYWDKYKDIIRGKTDMIIITDAVLTIPPGMKSKFLEWKKKEDVKVQSIVIGTDGGPMKEISDIVHTVNCMSVEDDATQLAFSI